MSTDTSDRCTICGAVPLSLEVDDQVVIMEFCGPCYDRLFRVKTRVANSECSDWETSTTRIFFGGFRPLRHDVRMRGEEDRR
jgi:hypothetical protein